jgi:hypothetical protein
LIATGVTSTWTQSPLGYSRKKRHNKTGKPKKALGCGIATGVHPLALGAAHPFHRSFLNLTKNPRKNPTKTSQRLEARTFMPQKRADKGRPSVYPLVPS